MQIESRKTDGLIILIPSDKSLEAANSKDFKSQIVDQINEGTLLIVLNLSKVEFMDSSGLGSLISIVKLLSNAHGKIVLCNVGDQIKKLFNLTRLNQVFQIFSNEQEAIDSLKIPTP